MRLGPDPLVLAYHAVADVAPDADPHRLATAPALLESHVRFLRRAGYEITTAEGLLDRRPARRTAVLTFDDGWRDALTTTMPLLDRVGVRATFFVCPGLWGAGHFDLGGDAGRLLSADEAGALAGAGGELGAHSLTHVDLRRLGDGDLEREVAGAKEAVEAVSGRRCRTFAYPYGLTDARVERAAERAGYELAFGWEPGPWRAMRAPRWPAPPRHGAGRLALKLLGVRRRRLTG